MLQDHHTKLDLTLSIFEDSYLSRAGEIPRGFQPIANRLPAQVRRGLLSAGMTPPPGMDETYRKSFAKMMDLASLLYRSGIQIEAGTDSMAGFALHRELELDAQAGIPPAQVLQNATLNAARIMSLDKDLGSIAPGKSSCRHGTNRRRPHRQHQQSKTYSPRSKRWSSLQTRRALFRIGSKAR